LSIRPKQVKQWSN